MEFQQGFGINGMRQIDLFAARQFLAAHVRYGSKATFSTPVAMSALAPIATAKVTCRAVVECQTRSVGLPLLDDLSAGE
jgi:hypothetical protein